MRLSIFLKLVVKELSKFPQLAFALGVISILLPLLEILVPLTLGRILNLLVLAGNSQSQIYAMVGVFIGLNIIKACLTALQLRFGFAFDAKVLESMRSKIMRRILTPTSEAVQPMLASMTMHLSAVSKFWGSMFWETWTSFLFMLGASVALFVIDQRLAVTALAPIPFVIWAVIFLAPRFRKAMEFYFSGMDAVGQELLEIAENQEFLKVSKMSRLVSNIFERKNRELTNRANRFGFWASLYAPIFDLVGAGATGLLVLAFIYFSDANGVGTGEFLSFFVFLTYFYRPLYGASALSESWQKAMVAYERLGVVGEEDLKLADKMSIESSVIGQEYFFDEFLDASVAFENVSFSYAQGQKVFSDLNVKFAKNKRCALIGGNGQGKSTLIKLFVGLLNPTAGKIIYSQKTPVFAYLPQVVFLQSGPLMDNLLHAHPSYELHSDTQKIKQITEEVLDLGARFGILDKLSTVDLMSSNLSHSSTKLSGGQRQLVGLWRFVVQASYADYLVLDEPDAYLDIDALSKVLPAVLKFFETKNVLLVSHHDRLVKSCDVVLIIKGGQLVSDYP